jgi:hypothetical protein
VIGQRTRPVRRRGAGASLSFLLLLCLVSLGSASSAPAFAAASPSPHASPLAAGETADGNGLSTFGIKPSHATLKLPLDTRSRLEYLASAGAAQPDYVAISNDTYQPLALSIYASDGFNTASEGFDLLPASKKPVDVGSWITLKSNNIVVKARSSLVVPFTVRVPQRVTPGDHVGGIVASLRTTEVDKKGDRVAIDHRVGVRVYLRVQGAISPRLTVTNLNAAYHQNWWNPFGSGRVAVSYTVHNVGNVRLGAGQSVRVSGWWGGTVQSPPISDVPELLPDNQHDEHIVVRSVVPAFRNSAVVSISPVAVGAVTDGRLTDIVAKVRFSAVPWALLVLLLILFLVAGLLLRRRLRRVPSPAAAAPRPAKAGTNVGATP